MEAVLFYIMAFAALVCAFLVIANPFSRSPVTSAMFLVLTIIALAGLFVLLHAYFLAAVQVLVYAGAVMVLFLFVIMLLDLRSEERRRLKILAAVGSIGSAAIILMIFLQNLLHAPVRAVESPAVEGGTLALGKLLFTQYVLPFEIVSVLLLVAIVGVVLLSKKELR